MRIDAGKVIERRRAEQRVLLDRAERFVAALDPAMDVRAVVVFGSVARGDFNLWSDVDVLVIAPIVDRRLLDRLCTIGRDIGLVEPLAWTPDELRRRLGAHDPIAVESMAQGVWLLGDGTSSLAG